MVWVVSKTCSSSENRSKISKQLSRCRRYSGLVLGSIKAGSGSDSMWDWLIQLLRSDEVEGIMKPGDIWKCLHNRNLCWVVKTNTNFIQINTIIIFILKNFKNIACWSLIKCNINLTRFLDSIQMTQIISNHHIFDIVTSWFSFAQLRSYDVYFLKLVVCFASFTQARQ